MYFYILTYKILNILLITSADTTKRNMFKRNMFTAENRKFLVYCVIFLCIRKIIYCFGKLHLIFSGHKMTSSFIAISC